MALIRAIPNSMPNMGVLVFDTDLRFIIAEGTALKRSGFLPEDVEGKTLSEVLPRHEVEELTGLYEQILEGATLEMPHETRNRFYILRTFPIVMSGNIVAGAILVEDVTVCSHLTKDLTIRAEEAEAANEEVEKFAFAVAHDMKTPLRTIVTYLSLLEEKQTESVDEETKTWTNYIFRAAEKLSKRVKYLLRYSRISRHVLDFEELNVEEIVHSTAQECGVQDYVTVGEMPHIAGDSVLMYQLLENLLSNSGKYRDKGRELKVHVSGINEDGNFVLTIKDNGIGFSNQYKDKIFEFFERLHTEEEGFPGEGMGLAICKRIAELHHGQITATGTPGEGSEFKIYFPHQ